jgi:hypothetical protein
MFGNTVPKIAPPLIQAIEDAVLLGNVKELEGVMDLIKEQECFPENLRYGIEALLYFRLHYGKGGYLEAKSEEQRREIVLVESLWGAELIRMIGHYPDMIESRYA